MDEVISITSAINVHDTDDSSYDSDSEDENDEINDGIDKWETLEHCGPLFSQPYKPLPNHIKLSYNKEKITLSNAAEEAACYFAELNSEKQNDNTIKNNFFNDWRNLMNEHEREIIQDINLCDFSEIGEYLVNENNNEENKKYRCCLIDGREEEVRNYKVTKPGIFSGKGNNSNNGKIRKRVRPEDVTINCSRNIAPEVNWMKVIENRKVLWLASWTCNVGGTKYMRLHPAAEKSMENERKKYEIARELGNHISNVRTQYMNYCENADLRKRQIGVALYLIDQLGLRPGDSNNTNTQGCCTLKVKNIKFLERAGYVKLEFIGKCSVLFKKEFDVPEPVYSKLEEFTQGKKEDDKIFDKINAVDINKKLNEWINDKSVSVKVFRTFNASNEFEKFLVLNTNSNSSPDEKIRVYNQGLKMISNFLNHESSSSRWSYLDPRIIIAWCQRNKIAIERIITKNRQEEVQWAFDDIKDKFPDGNYKFCPEGNETCIQGFQEKYKPKSPKEQKKITEYFPTCTDVTMDSESEDAE